MRADINTVFYLVTAPRAIGCRLELGINSNTMFTPSATRLTTPTARDWTYAETWIDQKVRGHSVPFERNADTLRALLALATYSQTAEEHRQIFNKASAETSTTKVYSKSRLYASQEEYRCELVSVIEQALPEATAAVIHSHATALLSISEQQGNLLARILALQTEIDALQTTSAISNSLEAQLSREFSTIQDIGRQHRTTAGHFLQFAAKNAQLRQSVDMNVAASFETTNRCSAGQRRAGVRFLVEDVVGEEQRYLTLLKQKKDLDLHLATFQGIQTDPNEAKAELDALRSQLDGMVARRDAAFDGLVKRESPGKTY